MRTENTGSTDKNRHNNFFLKKTETEHNRKNTKKKQKNGARIFHENNVFYNAF